MAGNRALSNSEIGMKIAELRKSRGMTQQNLADLVYEGLTTISKVEKGKRPNLSVDLLLRIAEALHVSMNDLCYTASESQSIAQERCRTLTMQAGEIFRTLIPEDQAAAVRMLRGLARDD